MTESGRHRHRLRVGDRLTTVSEEGVLLACRVTEVFPDGWVRVVPEEPIPPLPGAAGDADDADDAADADDADDADRQ